MFQISVRAERGESVTYRYFGCILYIGGTCSKRGVEYRALCNFMLLILTFRNFHSGRSSESRHRLVSRLVGVQVIAQNSQNMVDSESQ